MILLDRHDLYKHQQDVQYSTALFQNFFYTCFGFLYNFKRHPVGCRLKLFFDIDMLVVLPYMDEAKHIATGIIILLKHRNGRTGSATVFDIQQDNASDALGLTEMDSIRFLKIAACFSLVRFKGFDRSSWMVYFSLKSAEKFTYKAKKNRDFQFEALPSVRTEPLTSKRKVFGF